MPFEKRPVMQVAERALGVATQALGAGAEVMVDVWTGRSANTRFAVNQITSTGDVTDTRVEIAVAFGKRHASVETNRVEDAALREAIERAAAMAKLAPEDPEHMPLLGPQTYTPVPAAFDLATSQVGAEQRASAIKRVVDRARGASVVAAGYYEHDAGERALASSAGLRAWHASTRAELTTTARTSDGTGSGWAGAESQRVADIDAASLAAIAVDGAARSARPKALDPGRWVVVLMPAAVADLLAFLGSAMDARAADEGRSFFSKPGGGTRVGEKLFGDAITVESNPFDPESPGPPFDGEGFPLTPIKWIDGGAVARLRTSRYWAAQKNLQPTGYHQTLRLRGGQAERVEDLLVGIDRGLLVTRFHYTRWLDPKAMVVTGLTRDGVFLVEKGKIVAPVTNFRWNESPITMLANADAMTKHPVRVAGLERGGGTWAPALRTHDFNMASVSAAV